MVQCRNRRNGPCRTTALATGTYYASQTVGTCESALRFAVAVTVNNPAAPTGSATQIILCY